MFSDSELFVGTGNDPTSTADDDVAVYCIGDMG